VEAGRHPPPLSFLPDKISFLFSVLSSCCPVFSHHDGRTAGAACLVCFAIQEKIDILSYVYIIIDIKILYIHSYTYIYQTVLEYNKSMPCTDNIFDITAEELSGDVALLRLSGYVGGAIDVLLVVGCAR
jgi:hypothetical protein